MKHLQYVILVLVIILFYSCQKECPTESVSIDGFYWDISVEQLVGPEGGTLTDPTTGISVQIPAGALVDETLLFMGPAYNMPIDNNLHILTSEYYFGPDNVDFLIPVTISMPYTETELPAGVTEENLQMHRYNMNSDVLRTTNSSVDTENNIITALASDLSFYVPGGDIPPASVTLFDGFNITDGGITIAWESEHDMDFASFKLYYNSQPNITTGNIQLAEITNQSLKLSNMTTVTPQTTYYFKIFKFDQNGLVSESNEINVTTGEQSIVVTFNDTYLESIIREELNNPTGDITNTDLATITSIHAEDSQISDLSVLKYCTSLEWLYLTNNLITNLSPLSSLTNLEGLYLGQNNIDDIYPLATLESLTDLYLYHNQISDIRILGNLVNLDYLDIKYNNIEDVRFIRNLPKLERLYVSYNDINSISGLRNLPELQTFEFHYNNITNIDRVSDFPKLKYIHADGNNISDVSPLTNHSELYNVDMDYNQIVDIGPLVDNHPNLRYLYLQHNSITEVPSMVNLTNLRTCYFSYNPITNIDGLSGQTSVEYLEFYHCEIVDISSLETVTNIQTLQLGYNPIVDIEPLVNNTGLDNGDYLYIYGTNDLNNTSINTHIPVLEARGVNVYR